jgi:hypothetical protein
MYLHFFLIHNYGDQQPSLHWLAKAEPLLSY